MDSADLGADLAEPLADAGGHGHQDHPADGRQLRARPGDRAGRGVGPALVDRSGLGGGPRLHLPHPRHAVAGPAVHRVLRAAADRARDRPVPGGGARVQPERRRLRGRGDQGGDPEHPEGAVGGVGDHRHGLHDHAAARDPAAGGARRGAAAVEHVDLAGQGHVAGLDHPGDRAAAGGPAGGGPDVRLLRALRGGRGLLLGHLPDPVVRAEPAGSRLERYVAR